jgi:hypothetical protein
MRAQMAASVQFVLIRVSLRGAPSVPYRATGIPSLLDPIVDALVL